MNRTTILGLAITTAVSLASLPVANAADNCSGRISNVSISAETIEIAKGHTMVIFAAHSITSSDNSANNASGKCGGYAVTTPDGKTRSVGACVRKTKEGDSWSDEWVMEPGAEKGTWRQLGGTGVFAGKKWTGWWLPVSEDGKMFMGTWGGNCS